MNYDFSQLNDKEFEVLVCDLLSEVYGNRIERFKSGKDSGVDGRYFSLKNEEIIFQVKHYLKTGYKGLINKLKSEELNKLTKLKPTKYIFATSLPLSRNNKKEIRSILNKYIGRDDDIYGQEDLNDLLSKNKLIEEKHFKLWISSSNVLTRILNNAIKGRSEFEIEQIRNRSYKYIHTQNHDKAIEILSKKNVVIISGEPGVGKTTLAENLCLFYASKDFEFIAIEESLSEAESVYDRGRKQIFYFDDFLGSSYFEAIENKKDSHIIKFIDRVANDSTKRFILTSRTNILNIGLFHSSIFSTQKLNKNEFMITIESLSVLDKAKILYNHIWFSSLSEDFIDKIYEEKRYREIIHHRNFNPRLIEFITDVDRITVTESNKYWKYIEEMLNDPKEVWGNCFKVQNNEYVRNLVNLTVFQGSHISEVDLQNSFTRLNKIESMRNTSHTEKDFNSMAQMATKSFLNRAKENDEIKFSLFNPSIADYVLNEYSSDVLKLTHIIISLGSRSAIVQLDSLEKDSVITRDNCKKIRENIYNDALKEKRDYDYIIRAIYPFYKEKRKNNDIAIVLQKIIDKPEPVWEFTRLLELFHFYFDDLNFRDFDFIIDFIQNRYLYFDEIQDLANFLETNNINNEFLSDELKESLLKYLSDELETRVNDIDFSEFVSEPEDEYDYDYHWDEDDIKRHISEELDDLIREFNSKYINNFDIDEDSLVDEIDIYDRVQDYISSHCEIRPEKLSTKQKDYVNDIDDLFEKD